MTDQEQQRSGVERQVTTEPAPVQPMTSDGDALRLRGGGHRPLDEPNRPSIRGMGLRFCCLENVRCC
ncbi:hypothetical protein H634G_08101 [Metarhizium anisopliae BRIP 53293]|uniref:Uncharacterized protein n=1 Tax=Metarhizium anisopliae BRIP 53293 TaxID=1291518 RepID=A0A0D9NS01_METAN|nr:hypothetical protein H634G_08101 [Metarhizium anisopliae BRIP 53293]KJK85724.1 hypothetical protein H633G_10430 [Metarhizium anisopliae BRIP 53284]